MMPAPVVASARGSVLSAAFSCLFGLHSSHAREFALAIWIRFHALAARRRCGSSACAALHSLGFGCRLLVVIRLCHAPSTRTRRRRNCSRPRVVAARRGRDGGGNGQQAENLLKKSLITSPDDAATRSSLAEALWHRGAEQEALDQMAEAVQLDTSERKSERYGRAKCPGNRGERCRTELMPNARSVLDPKLASAWALRGRCFQKMNQPDRALADLQHALDFAPDNSDVLLDVAVLYRQRGQASAKFDDGPPFARHLSVRRRAANRYLMLQG